MITMKEGVFVPCQLKEQISRRAVYSGNVVASRCAVEALSLIHSSCAYKEDRASGTKVNTLRPLSMSITNISRNLHT